MPSPFLGLFGHIGFPSLSKVGQEAAACPKVIWRFLFFPEEVLLSLVLRGPGGGGGGVGGDVAYCAVSVCPPGREHHLHQLHRGAEKQKCK